MRKDGCDEYKERLEADAQWEAEKAREAARRTAMKDRVEYSDAVDNGTFEGEWWQWQEAI